MSLPRIATGLLAIIVLAACADARAGVREPSAQTLCNAIGSEISVTPDAEQSTATRPKAQRAHSVRPTAPAPAAAGGGGSRGGGDATVEPRGRWKSFLPGTFK